MCQPWNLIFRLEINENNVISLRLHNLFIRFEFIKTLSQSIL
jgi:hypothetical protein